MNPEYTTAASLVPSEEDAMEFQLLSPEFVCSSHAAPKVRTGRDVKISAEILIQVSFKLTTWCKQITKRDSSTNEEAQAAQKAFHPAGYGNWGRKTSTRVLKDLIEF